ncbi:MAG TPA: RagB/SusD family nutrient uptake outer membrane protein [Pedobacter sp.]|jgi:hypothetical protein
MNKYLKYNIVCLLGASLIVGSGCKKILEPDPKALTVDVLYSDFNGSYLGVNGIYSGLTSVYRDGGILDVDYASDDVMGVPIGNSGYNQVDYFEMEPAGAGPMFGIMDGFYRIIYRANVAIGRIPNAVFPARDATNQGTQRPFKEQFVGEAKFLRAFSYFQLVRVFGGVPIHTEEIKASSEVNKPRASVAEVYALIETDLADAIEKLPATGFGGGQGRGNEPGRATKWSAMALLADVYLTQKKYDLARTTALAVINNNGGKSLNPRYVDNFPARTAANPVVAVGPENTQESLFEIQFQTQAGSAANGNVGTGNTFSGGMGPAGITVDGRGGIQQYRPTDSDPGNSTSTGIFFGLLQAYEAGDVRVDVNFSRAGNLSGAVIPLTHKYYENRNAAGNGNFPIYRMAEMYLIYAEAVNELGVLDAAGLEYVNRLRRRAAGATSLTAARPTGPVADFAAGQSQAVYRELIRNERRRELAMENKRWFDLIRYGFDYAKDALVTKQSRTNFNENKFLFPIPRIEFTNNPNLGAQNPGYTN